MSVSQPGGVTRPTQSTRGPAPPGTQNRKGDPRAAAQDLHLLAAAEFKVLSDAMYAFDPRGMALSKDKLEQIFAAGRALGLQGEQGTPSPQGARTGVPTPVGRPVDPLTRQGV
jgi:hypothetical protein